MGPTNFPSLDTYTTDQTWLTMLLLSYLTSVNQIADSGEDMLMKGTRSKFRSYLEQAADTLSQQSESAATRIEGLL